MRSSRVALVVGPLSFAVLFTALAFVGCSDDTPNAADASRDPHHDEPARESGTSTSSSSGSSGGADVEAPAIRCTDQEFAAIDRTAAADASADEDAGTFDIVFETGANPRQYTNRCQTVKVGTTIVFRGSFAQHPLEPAGGDSPNPFPYTAEDTSDGTLSVTMTTAGTFGYQCEFHPTSMFGAIKVVP